MELEAARLTLGLVVAMALPPSVRAIRRQRLAGWGFSALYAAYVIFPVLDGWPAATLWAAALLPGLAESLGARKSQIPDSMELPSAACAPRSDRLRWHFAHLRADRTGLLIMVALVLSIVLYYRSHTGNMVLDLVQNDQDSVILSGILAAVFVGNLLVAVAVEPYLGGLSAEELRAFVPTGTYLGWVERCLVFVFITAGQPEAAALAITVKSLARIPEVQRHKGTNFGQYVIVGTLTSLLVAVAAGITVRLALGLPPL